MNTRTIPALLIGFSLFCTSTALGIETGGKLFATDAPGNGWRQFPAAGYCEPACGVIYRLGDRITDGMPLGGIDTGCIDIESNGTFGIYSIFNTLVPERGEATLRAPVLALHVGDTSWALCGPPAKGIYTEHQATWLPSEFGNNQPAWSPAPDAARGWARSSVNGKYDLPVGQVFCHTPARLRWTSPESGEIEIRGGLWMPRKTGTQPHWEFRKNSKPFASGTLASGPTSASPQPFAAGGVLKTTVTMGDRIELVLGEREVDFVGVRLTISNPTHAKTWDVASDWSDARNPNGPWSYHAYFEGPGQHLKRPNYCLFRDDTFPQIRRAKQIHYWGHYPVADLEFETDAPVQVGMRAWSPFLPGSVKESAIPAAIFEVRLHNTTASKQQGALAFNFPGPSPEEAGGARIERREVQGAFHGVEVKTPLTGYAVGTLGDGTSRIGADLGMDTKAWMTFNRELPRPKPGQTGACAAVDFDLAPGQQRIVRFVLTWCAPDWRAGGRPSVANTSSYTHMYARFYPDPAETAKLLAMTHHNLLQRILAWQQVIYAEQQLPIWLRDSLVNSLHLITETSLWAQAKAPLGKWCRSEDGLFGMIECPRECPQVENIPSSLFGNLPVVYFFPELVHSTLRGYKNYQWPDGQVVWMFGKQPLDFSEPTRPYQVASSDICMIEILDKMWLCTGDDALLKEFYDGCKRATIHAMNLRPDYGDKQVVAMAAGDKDMEWVECVPLFGLDSHVGGIRLAHLRMMKRMADKMGDAEFAKQCDKWIAAGMKTMEDDLWAGSYYLLFNEFKSGKKCDFVMGCQLDGEWLARFHGVPSVFPHNRIRTTLATIAKANADPKRCPYGMRIFAKADGSKAEGNFALWGDSGTYSALGFMLGMTYMYDGERAFGEDLLRRAMDYVVLRNGNTWDFPLLWQVDTGYRVYGSDYYQNMILWSVPAVMANQDLAGPCKHDGMVSRVLEAAKQGLPRVSAK